ncbi:HNH endonuclease [Desulfonema magnum]|uniref:HNH endonuclease n=1 Tax=Desulfonema magnum TaxID=45655 RepID=A0A975BXI8_9BACT|nr:HNH endonuclease signature motif containing protein [Desulfonema magnum]QTA93556.1 HNH endonuclease [Desulfonema magnum]
MPERRVTAEQRRIVTERANNCCEYCLSQSRFATESFSVEHIIPRFLSGQTELKNLALACQGCNGHKHIRIREYDSVTGKDAPLYHPRMQKWNDDFRWNDDFTLIIGMTPTGRATVEALKLNREGLVNLRGVLYAAGKHPP